MLRALMVILVLMGCGMVITGMVRYITGVRYSDSQELYSGLFFICEGVIVILVASLAEICSIASIVLLIVSAPVYTRLRPNA